MAVTNITPPPAVAAVRNPVILTATADPGWAAMTNYRLELQIEVEPVWMSGTWETRDTVYEYPDAAGQVTFDLAALVEGEVAADLPAWPAATAAAVASQMIRRVRLTLREYGNGSLLSTSAAMTSYVLRAGRNSYAGQDLAAYSSGAKFLTWQPSPKLAHESQPEWLYWIRPDASETYSLRGRLRYEDGTEAASVALGPQVAPGNLYDVVIWPAGYTQLALQNQPKPVQSWELWIQDSGGAAVSERLWYSRDCLDAAMIPRFFLFEGSLGGWHSLRTGGEGRWDIAAEGVQLDRQLGHNAPTTAAARGWNRTQYREGFQQYSGYFSREEVEWLRDLLISEQVYRVGGFAANYAGAGDLVPLVLNRGTAQVRRDNDFLFSLEFSYADARSHRGL